MIAITAWYHTKVKHPRKEKPISIHHILRHITHYRIVIVGVVAHLVLVEAESVLGLVKDGTAG